MRNSTGRLRLIIFRFAQMVSLRLAPGLRGDLKQSVGRKGIRIPRHHHQHTPETPPNIRTPRAAFPQMRYSLLRRYRFPYGAPRPTEI